jgi:riboflavin transporter FmnP
MRIRVITGTAMLGALVIVLDLTFWLAKIKIPFPIFPRLKFDFDGVPIILSLYLYGPYSSFVTSCIAFLVISFRDPVSAFMKALAEFSTALGIIPFYNKEKKFFQLIGIINGIIVRVIVTSISNILVLPFFQILPLEAVIAMLPFIIAFNIAAGAISAFLGYILYESLKKRIGL